MRLSITSSFLTSAVLFVASCSPASAPARSELAPIGLSVSDTPARTASFGSSGVPTPTSETSTSAVPPSQVALAIEKVFLILVEAIRTIFFARLGLNVATSHDSPPAVSHDAGLDGDGDAVDSCSVEERKPSVLFPQPSHVGSVCAAPASTDVSSG